MRSAENGGIAWEHVRHEEAAAFAASAEAALTGDPRKFALSAIATTPRWLT